MRTLLLCLLCLLTPRARAEDQVRPDAAEMSVCSSLRWEKITPKAAPGEPEPESWHRLVYQLEPTAGLPDLLTLAVERRGTVPTLRFFLLVDRKVRRAFGTKRSVAVFVNGSTVDPVPEQLTQGEARPRGKVIGIYPRFQLSPDQSRQVAAGLISTIALGEDGAATFRLPPEVAAQVKRALECVNGVASGPVDVVPTGEESPDADALRRLEVEPPP